MLGGEEKIPPACCPGDMPPRQCVKGGLQPHLSGMHGRLQVAVEGESMLPALLPKDTVIARPVLPTGLRIGDIVIAGTRGDTPVIHRIVATGRCRDRLWVLTRGDAAACYDRPLPAVQVIARVIEIIRGSESLTLMPHCLSLPARLRAAYHLRRALAGDTRYIGRIPCSPWLLGKSLCGLLRPLGRRPVERPSPEFCFLLRCLTHLLESDFKPLDSAFAAEFAEKQPDWDLLERLAVAHGVAPLLHHCLADAARDVPPETLALLAASRERTTVLSGLATMQLDTILKTLHQAGLPPPLLMRGIALAHTLYPSAGLRPMQDMDFLVHEDAFAATATALVKQGYSQSVGETPSQWHRDIWDDFRHSTSLVPPPRQPGLGVDLHRRLVLIPGLDFTACSQKAQPAAFVANPALIPHLARQLAIVLHHLVKHRDDGDAGALYHWFDLALCLKHPDLQPDDLASCMAALPDEYADGGREAEVLVRGLFSGEISGNEGASADNALLRQIAAVERAPFGPGRGFAAFHQALRHAPRLRSPLARLRFISGYLAPPPSFAQQKGVRGNMGLVRWYLQRPLALAAKMVKRSGTGQR